MFKKLFQWLGILEKPFNVKDFLDFREQTIRDIKNIKEELEKIDIKAMEAQRSYRAKLKRLTGDNETETNKNSNILLSPNGTLI